MSTLPHFASVLLLYLHFPWAVLDSPKEPLALRLFCGLLARQMVLSFCSFGLVRLRYVELLW